MEAEPVPVVFLVSTLRRTGPTSQLLNIVRYLDRSEFAPVVVTLSPEPNDSMCADFEGVGVTVRSMSRSRLRGALRRGWRSDIERLVSRRLNGCSIVHSQGIRADVISARSLVGSVRISTARNYPCDDYPMKFGTVVGWWMARQHLRAFRRLPSVVACSAALATSLRRHGVVATVVRNGVDTSIFHAVSELEKERLRSELGLPRHVRVGICVGSLLERKNPLSVVRAMKAIESRDLAMIFVGDGELKAQCERETQCDPRIRFVGHVADVRRYLHVADFFVSASKSEGMPNSVLEAVACGLPVLLSDIEPHREILGFAPEAGLLFESGDVHALANAIVSATSGGMLTTLSAKEVERLVGATEVSHHYQRLYRKLIRGEGIH